MSDLDIGAASVAQLNAWYRDGRTTPVEVASAVIAVADTAGRALNAVAVLNTEEALTVAQQSTQRWSAGRELGPLDGVPVSIKDSFPMMGLKRWHGSALSDGLAPSARDGAPVKRLREAGAVLFAKTTMPDFGLIASGISSQFGIIRNPWNPALTPGGSSSGSAALLALGAGPLSLGTDMGGSVRQPAAFCGLVGLKPTQGRIAYDPPKLIGSPGPMGRSTADIAALLEVVGKPDDSDHLSLPGSWAWDGTVPNNLTGVRVGVLLTLGDDIGVHPEIVAAVENQAEILAGNGAEIIRIDKPPATPAQRAVVGTVLATRGLPELLSAPETLWDRVPAELLDGLVATRELSAVEHVTNERAMEALRATYAAVFNSFDYVLSPVSPVLPFRAEDATPTRGVFSADHLGFTLPYNLTSLPAGTVPVAVSTSGLPIGVQIGGRRFDDAGVLAMLALLEYHRAAALDYPFAAGVSR
ncbi:MAG: amidase family protein [Gordonia sp. (in: high G+C Gram-positive bacteria)]